MNYYEFEEEEEESTVTLKKKKQQQMTLMLLILGVGVGYYFLLYLPKKRNQALTEIKTMLENNPRVNLSDLDAKLWAEQENWEEYLTDLYLNSQIQQFTKQMKEAIKAKAEELEKSNLTPEQIKDIAIEEIKSYCKPEELELPNFKKIIKEYSKKIKQEPLDNISTLQKEVNDLIVEERVKKQGLHWKRKREGVSSWAEKWLQDNVQTFEQAWAKMEEIMKREPEHFNIAASYKIKFPPTLWNNLTDEQRKHKKTEELILGDDVPTYQFSKLITEWEEKAKADPIRGERDPDTKLDNNALFYGAPRTGKSVMSEKLAYEADKYPLVVIQGSTLTPKDLDYKSGIDPLGKFIFTLCDIDYTLTDDFGFEREDNGEVRYILFVDEANQITTSTLISKSTELTFLKECMGSDTRINESKNLWIMATNHLDQVNPAVYQPGRLSNPLDFSWTLIDFKRYAEDAGIASQFPDHLSKIDTLNDEDNKWANRFNKMYFDDKFLPFWDKFINNNPNAEYEPEKDEENNEERNDNFNNYNKEKRIKIKWGEIFEFFWRLFDSKQLEAFQGKFDPPRQPKIEEVVAKNLTLTANQISKSIDIRLKELTETAENIKEQSQTARSESIATLEAGLDSIRAAINEIR